MYAPKVGPPASSIRSFEELLQGPRKWAKSLPKAGQHRRSGKVAPGSDWITADREACYSKMWYGVHPPCNCKLPIHKIVKPINLQASRAYNGVLENACTCLVGCLQNEAEENPRTEHKSQGRIGAALEPLGHGHRQHDSKQSRHGLGHAYVALAAVEPESQLQAREKTFSVQLAPFPPQKKRLLLHGNS